MDIKVSKTQLSKIFQLFGLLGNLMSNLSKKALIDLANSLAEDVLLKLANKATPSILDKFERKIRGQGAVRAQKGFTLFTSNEDIMMKMILSKPWSDRKNQVF